MKPQTMQDAVAEAGRKARDAQRHHIRNLPAQIERARRRLEMLERDAERHGVVL